MNEEFDLNKIYKDIMHEQFLEDAREEVISQNQELDYFHDLQGDFGTSPGNLYITHDPHLRLFKEMDIKKSVEKTWIPSKEADAVIVFLREYAKSRKCKRQKSKLTKACACGRNL
jgi:hypothetical protein